MKPAQPRVSQGNPLGILLSPRPGKSVEPRRCFLYVSRDTTHMQTHFHSLSSQVAASLRDEIARGGVSVLPSERELAQRLQVSRRTVRNALGILRSDGFVRTEARRTVSLKPRGRGAADKRRVQINLLLPEPLAQSRPFTVLWISFLADLMHKNGFVFEIVSGGKFYGDNSGRSLERLVREKPAACWVLGRTNEPLQRWFDAQETPAIVAGSVYPSVTLPSVDNDHVALGHHAAMTFMRHGHTRIALFYEKPRHAGDIEAENSFKAAFAKHIGTPESLVVRVERSPGSVIRELRRMLALRSPPTGFMFSSALGYLTTQGYLNSLGYNIPRDFSMMAQDEGIFFSHVYPAPARYTVSANKFAVALTRMIKQMLDGRAGRGLKIRIMPDFLPGASVSRIGAPPPVLQTGV